MAVGFPAGGVIDRRVRVEPVTVLEAGAPQSVAVQEVSDLADEHGHRFVCVSEDLRVPVFPVQRPREADRDIAPQSGRRRGRGQDVWDDPGDEPGCLLLDGQVLQPGPEDTADVVQERRGGRERVDVAGPAEALVALRAVGGDADEVVPHRPHRVGVQLVQQRVRRFQPPGAAHVGMGDDRANSRGVQLTRPAVDLHVPEAVEREPRLPRFRALTTGNVLVGGFRSADRLHVDLSVGHHFRVPQRDDRPGIGACTVKRTRPDKFCPKSTTVLPVGVVITSTGASSSTLRIGSAAESMSASSGQSTMSTGPHSESSKPAASHPVRLKAGIKGLAVIDAVGPDPSGRGAELSVAADDLDAVGVFEDEFGEQRGPVRIVVALVLPTQPAQRPSFSDDRGENVVADDEIIGHVVLRNH